MFVKTQWRALKLVNRVNNLFTTPLFGFMFFLIIKIDCDIRGIEVVFS